MKHNPLILQMLLIIGGVELNPGPKTSIREDTDGLSSHEESGSRSLQHESISAAAKTLQLLTACQSQILNLQTQMGQLTKHQQEDRKIIESLQLEVTELKSSLQDIKSNTTQPSAPTSTQQPSLSGNQVERTRHKLLQQVTGLRSYLHDMKLDTTQQSEPTSTEQPSLSGNKVERTQHRLLQQVTNYNWTNVVHTLEHVWKNEPEAYAQLQQLAPEEMYPLLTICERGYTDLIEVLLDHGMDVKTVAYEEYGDTLLHVAAHLNQLSLATLLLNRGAQTEQCEQFGFTPLITAARAGHMNIVQLLVEHGANINATTHNGRTSLYWAASLGHYSIVKYLIKQGADTKIKDKIKMQTAEAVARNEGYYETALYIANNS